MHLRIGLFGGGVVGGGVYELLQKYTINQRFLQAYGISMEIVKICVRSLDKPRDFVIDHSKVKIVTDYQEILSDSTINCVVELMGGVDLAKTVILEAIRAGKHVVSANKALIASCLPEIEEELHKNPHIRFGYEAAVCGSIPIIHSLQTDYVANKIESIAGIMNGTTNFMLCKMEAEGLDYHTVLKEAQDLGFAEADPTADVEGFDVQAKIALLAKLSFGQTIPVNEIPTTGISKITTTDFDYAKANQYTIKLLGTAQMNAETQSLAVYVAPTLVPLSSPLSLAKGPGNMVVVNSENMGLSTYSGPGAGRYPTANSVVNDLVRIAQGLSIPPFPLQSQVKLSQDYTSRFYIRLTCKSGLDIIKLIGSTAEQCQLSLASITQTMIKDSTDCTIIISTEITMVTKIQSFLQLLSTFPLIHELPFYLPILKG